MRSVIAVVLGVFLLAGSAFAGGCSLGGHEKHTATLIEASKALEATNPELAAKVKSIAENCCKKDAAKSEHPAAGGSEHPSSEHPN